MKRFTVLLAASLVAGGIAFANEKGSSGMMGGGMAGGGMMGGDMQGMMNMMRHMQTMDANGDGMLSKDEFMKTHEAMFDSMPKNPDGLVAMKEMAMCPMMGGQKGR